MKLIDQIRAGSRVRSGRWRGAGALAITVGVMAAVAPRAGAQTSTTAAAATTSGSAVVLKPADPPAARAQSAAPSSAPGTVTASAAAATRPSPLNPSPAEFPKSTPAPSSSELDGLLARVAALRSRIDALTNAMFSSRLRVEVRAGGDTVRLEALHVSLDGGVVYTAPPRAVFDRPEVVFEHAVAPGAHVVAIEVERHDAQNPQFSTWQESRFVVLVPEKKLLWTRIELDDASSMAEDFRDDHAGKYQLQVKLQAEVNE